MTGRWPENTIDHRDLDRSNNRWTNLREATYSQQRGNSLLQARSTSGVRGVTFDKRTGKWQAMLAGRYLGQFVEKHAAHAVYRSAASDFFKEFLR